MSPRAWLSAFTITLLLGILVGWSGRVLTLHDRYIAVQIELQDTETKYFRMKTDQMIRDNERRNKQ